jgi:hypothetical protein
MRSVVFADLDGTLIDSLRGLPCPADARVVAHDRHGSPVSVQTAEHRRVFELLSGADAVVPVTGRSVAALARVDLPFGSYRVAHHGATVITADGSICQAYREHVCADLAETHLLLSDVGAEVEAWIRDNTLPLRVNRQVLDDLVIEVCVKSTHDGVTTLGEPGDHLEAKWSTLDGTRIHRNGNNLALMSRAVTKTRAVAWVGDRLREALGSFVSFGIGDSTSDFDFMRSCDYLIVPRRSQLAGALGARGT